MAFCLSSFALFSMVISIFWRCSFTALQCERKWLWLSALLASDSSGEISHYSHLTFTHIKDASSLIICNYDTNRAQDSKYIFA